MIATLDLVGSNSGARYSFPTLCKSSTVTRGIAFIRSLKQNEPIYKQCSMQYFQFRPDPSNKTRPTRPIQRDPSNKTRQTRLVEQNPSNKTCRHFQICYYSINQMKLQNKFREYLFQIHINFNFRKFFRCKKLYWVLKFTNYFLRKASDPHQKNTFSSFIRHPSLVSRNYLIISSSPPFILKTS